MSEPVTLEDYIRERFEADLWDKGYRCPICPEADRRLFAHDGPCAAGTPELRGILGM